MCLDSLLLVATQTFFNYPRVQYKPTQSSAVYSKYPSYTNRKLHIMAAKVVFLVLVALVAVQVGTNIYCLEMAALCDCVW
jgi:hypothetical protein